MSGVVAASRTVLAKGDLSLNLLFVFSRKVVDVAASGAFQSYEVFRIL